MEVQFRQLQKILPIELCTRSCSPLPCVQQLVQSVPGQTAGTTRVKQQLNHKDITMRQTVLPCEHAGTVKVSHERDNPEPRGALRFAPGELASNTHFGHFVSMEMDVYEGSVDA